MGNVPYEILEASDNILPENIEGSDHEKELEEFNDEEIKKRQRELDSDEDADEGEDSMEYEFSSGSERNEEAKVSDEEEHAKAG